MISIIVPVYNAHNTLKRCLDSILKQDFKDIQIIAINDGSSDDSLDILKEYAFIDKRIEVINQENQGVSVARNNGIASAKGEYIMFVDSDDYIEPQTCSSLLKYLKSDIQLVIFGLNIYKGNILQRTPHLSTKCIELKDNIDYYWNLRTINLGPCNKIYRKSLIKQNFDTSLSLGEDTLFVLEYLKEVNKVQIVSDCYYNVSLDNSGSLNRKYREDRLEQLIKVREKEMKILNELYPNSKDRRIYEEFFRNLHVILTNIMRMNFDDKYKIIKSNMCRFNYPYSFVKFPSLYYSIFAYLVVNRMYFTTYFLMALRVMAENLLIRKK